MHQSAGSAPYLLGQTSAEHARLIRQATIFDPLTERLFRDAGIGPGQRVLDVGSGVGDVAILAARLVGPSGEVVGVEREPATVATARARVAEAGLANVRFLESDVREVVSSQRFDALVGRAILSYLPDAIAVFGSLAALVRPDGVFAFQDVWPASLLQMTAYLPLRAKCGSLVYRVFERSGAVMDIERVLYRAFQDVGLPAPNMRIEVPVGDHANVVQWLPDLLLTVASRLDERQLADTGVGDLDTLRSRLEEERLSAKSFAATIGLVGAWARKPG